METFSGNLLKEKMLENFLEFKFSFVTHLNHECGVFCMLAKALDSCLFRINFRCISVRFVGVLRY